MKNLGKCGADFYGIFLGTSGRFPPNSVPKGSENLETGPKQGDPMLEARVKSGGVLAENVCYLKPKKRTGVLNKEEGGSMPPTPS